MIYVEDELREGSSRSWSLPNYGVNIDRSAHRTGPVVAMPSFGRGVDTLCRAQTLLLSEPGTTP